MNVSKIIKNNIHSFGYSKKVHIGHFNIQKYLKGDHFSKVHSERTNLSTIHRIFAWMTYLNDVEDGGTTDFKYYDLKIKPKRQNNYMAIRGTCS